MDLRENLRMTKRKIRRGKIRVYSAYLIFKYSFWYLFCQKVHVEIKLLISVTLDFGNHKWARTERYIFDIWSYQTVRMYQINYWKYMRLRKCVLIFIFRFGLPDHNLSDFKMDISYIINSENVQIWKITLQPSIRFRRSVARHTLCKFGETVSEIQDCWNKFLRHTLTTIKSWTLPMRFSKEN